MKLLYSQIMERIAWICLASFKYFDCIEIHEKERKITFLYGKHEVELTICIKG